MTRNKHGVPNTKGSVWMMQHKFFAWAMSMALAATIACTGCTQTDSGTSSNTESAIAQVTTTENGTEATDSTEDSASSSGLASGETLSSIQTGEIGVTTDEDDLCSTYDSFDAEITLADNATKVSGSSGTVSVNGNQVTISAGGTYHLTGTLTDGQVVVTGTEKVKLYLDGVQITNCSGPAICCTNEKRTILSMADGTENTLADGAEDAGTEEIDACALFAQDKLTINGSGSLTITGSTADGIVCKDDLKLVDGKITVTAADDGVRGKDCVAMFGAELNVTAGNDGIKSTETEDATKGFLQLEQGSAVIQAGGDCLQAETLVWVLGGTYDLTSTGTSTDADTGESNSAKGIHCSGDVELTDGTVTIDAQEDGVHCNGAFEMIGGTLDVTSAEDGVQADGDLTISAGTTSIVTTGEVAASSQDDFGGGFGGGMQGGNVPSGGGMQGGNMGGSALSASDTQTANIEASVLTGVVDTQTTDSTTDTEDASSKGIKCGGNMVLSGGSCTITSTDHAVHATGTAILSGISLDITSDNKGISTHGDLTISDGDITIHNSTEGIESKANMTFSGGTTRILCATDDGLNTGGTGDSHAMQITGGYLYICADGDGVDSNGTWDMSGGTLIVCGPVSGADGSLDANDTMTYTGGTLLALSSNGMMEYPTSGCLIGTNCSASAGDQISIVDADGNVLVTVTSPKAVSDVIYGIGDADSSNYTIVTGGTYSGTLNADNYGEGGTVTGGTEVTASAGTGNNGGMGGMGGGGMQQGNAPGGM